MVEIEVGGLETGLVDKKNYSVNLRKKFMKFEIIKNSRNSKFNNFKSYINIYLKKNWI